MAIKYVKDFEHPEGFGFSGSAGKVMVKAYARGGPVRVKGPATPGPMPAAMPAMPLPKAPKAPKVK